MLNLITGILGQSLFVLCVLPQLIRTIRTENVEGLSVSMWWLYILAEGFTIIYFATLPIVPMIALVQCVVSFLLCSYQLGLIYKYGEKYEQTN